MDRVTSLVCRLCKCIGYHHKGPCEFVSAERVHSYGHRWEHICTDHGAHGIADDQPVTYHEAVMARSDVSVNSSGS